MTAIIVIKILLVGALLGGFIMFSLYRRKQEKAVGKKVCVIATMVSFVFRLVLIGAIAIFSFWFVTKFLA
jgi:hypothetical protein